MCKRKNALSASRFQQALAATPISGAYACDAWAYSMCTYESAGDVSFTEYEKINQSGTVEKQSYVYCAYVDEPIALITANGTTSYYNCNSLYSTEVMTDSSGAIVERVDYNSYGKATIRDNLNNIIAASLVDNPYFFTGRRLDTESALYYFRNRYFDAELGRFISRDPIRRGAEKGADGLFKVNDPNGGDGYHDGMGLYAGYFIPNGIDPYGLADCEIVIYLGHNSWVPQKGETPDACSQYAIYSCGTSATAKPYVLKPADKIPGADRQSLIGCISNHQGCKSTKKALKKAQQPANIAKLCKGKCGCTEITIKVECQPYGGTLGWFDTRCSVCGTVIIIPCK